jgi:hypothetical protein
MRIIPGWQNDEIVGRELKSCDNRTIGDAKEVNGPILVATKNGRRMKIPTEAIATFDGDKVYLRATEAEVVAGVYPFIAGEEEYRRENRDGPESERNDSFRFSEN